MLLAPQPNQLDEWKQSLNQYQRNKRTKRPFGKTPPQPQTNLKQQFLQKEMKFNPVLQSFRDERDMSKTIEHQEVQKANQQFKHIKNNYKYNVEYDIINFAPSISLPKPYRSLPPSPETRKKQYKDPTYYDFNIIDGSNYNPSYLRNRSLRAQKRYQRKIHHKDSSYNIINNTYSERQNHLDQDSSGFSSLSKSTQMSPKYDPIYGRYYNPEEEQKYQNQLKSAEQQHAHKVNIKLPPSYINRQSLVLDQTAKPSSIVQSLDMKKQKAKQRYKLRYLVEDEHQLRSQYDTERKDQIIKNRIHQGRLQQQKAREFNILNSKAYQQRRTEKLFGKQITGGVYDLRGYGSTNQNKSTIKNSGFKLSQQ